jgi:3-oxoadipate enol-lactonase
VTIVFSGSLGSDKRMWEPQRRDGIDGVRLEHPGHGGAPLVEVRDMADLAAAALAAIDAPRFSFVGVSLGGAVGMRIALDAPDRLERLALICTSARFGESQGWLDRAALVREQGLEVIVDMLMERWFTPEFSDVRRYREMFLATDPEGYARCCDALAVWDTRDEIGRIAAPTLVVSGADDPAAPPAAGALLAERIPNAGHAVLQNARHLASVERAADVNALLREHLG